MTVFEYLRYKNFLAVGNEFIEIDFLNAKSTIIIGTNGAGKSSFIDAICFVLYNKPFRNINKPNLVNSILGKGTLVEVEFSINKDKYLVRRGIRPAIFEIIKNGELINQSAETKDYQTILEKQILKMNYKSFIQIVILGSANYVPFMKLPSHSRREVIEDLLDIQIFSVMNSLLKEKYNTNKIDLKEIEFKQDLCKSKIKLNKQHLEALKQNNEDIIESKRRKILKYQDDIETQQILFNQSQETLNQYNIDNKAKNKSNKILQQISKLRDDLKKKLDKVTKEIEFYSQNDDCPVCKQRITESFKHSTIEEKQSTKEQLTTAIVDLNTKYDDESKIIQELTNNEESYNKLYNESKGYENYIVMIRNNINDLLEEIEELNNKNDDIHIDSESQQALETELDEIQQNKERLLCEREIYGTASILLKDGGIKTRVVKQYIPVMNKLINQFLASMDFYVDFRLDENFNEKILSQFKDEFSYESFSEGEKVRINLAILFCWRMIAKLRNSASCSLLIMDEILDGSLDSNGIEDFLKILNTITPNTNVFVISHKTEMIEKFERTLKFTNQKNFSTMEKL